MRYTEKQQLKLNTKLKIFIFLWAEKKKTYSIYVDTTVSQVPVWSNYECQEPTSSE